jgi:hypothetical protein
MERRFGFRAIRPLASDAGHERFGVIDLQGGGHAAVLALRAPAGGAIPPPAALAAAIPDYPIQFLLSRRPVDPAGLLRGWRAGAQARLGEAAAARVWADLAERYLPALEAAGLTDLWCGVAVAAGDLDTLTGRVAELFAGLPYDAAPATAGELEAALGRLLRPGDGAGGGRPFPLGGARALDLPALTPRPLLIGPDAVAPGPDVVTTYWLITPAGPTSLADTLLTLPALQGRSFDLSMHIRPATTQDAMRGVLDARLARVEAQLAGRGGAPAGAPAGDAPPEATGRWLLELERREVTERRERLAAGPDRPREVVALLAAHHAGAAPGGRGPVAGPEAIALGVALREAGLTARLVTGRPALSRAVRDTLPLGGAPGGRAFAVSAGQAAAFAALPAPRAGQTAGPPLGLLPDGALYGDPADRPDRRVLAGGPPAAGGGVGGGWGGK